MKGNRKLRKLKLGGHAATQGLSTKKKNEQIKQ